MTWDAMLGIWNANRLCAKLLVATVKLMLALRLRHHMHAVLQRKGTMT